MLEKLKKKSIVKKLPTIIILIIVGLGLIGLEFWGIIALMRGHVEFETLEPEEISRGLVVDASIAYNFGGFMEKYEENTSTHVTRTTDVYYVICTGNENSKDSKYMAIKVPASDEWDMEQMAENTYNGLYSEPISYSGAINKMSSKEYQYFKEWFMEGGWTEDEVEEYTLPYYISVGALTGGAASSVYFFVVIGLILILNGVIMLIYVLTGKSLGAFKKQIAETGLSDMDVEREYEGAKLFNKRNDLRIGKRITFFMIGNKPQLIVNDQIVWAYQQTTTHRTNGIKTGTSYGILIYQLNSKKNFSISVPNANAALEILQYMNETMPKAVIGYSDDLSKLYRKNKQEFLQLRYYRVEQPTVQESQVEEQPEQQENFWETNA